MASFTSKFLKKRFIDAKGLEAVTDRASPFVAVLDKIQMGGASVAEPCILSGPQGDSYSLTAAQAVAAQADRGASHYEEFNSTFGDHHGVAVISAKAVAGSKTNKEAYLRQVDEVMTSKVKSWTSTAARKMLGPVGGHIGRISDLNEGGGDGEIQLTITGDALNFVAGQILQAADGTGNGAPSNVRAGLGYVIAAYPDADVTGTSTTGAHVFVATSEALRIAGTTGGPSGWTDNDYLFRNGDVAAATDLSDSIIRSYQSWVTLTAATGTFNGVNRSQDARLSGFRLTAAESGNLSIKSRMELLAVKGRKQCGAMDALLYVVGPQTWNELSQEVQSYGQLVFEKDVKIGAQMITLITVNGPAKVMADPHCSESDIFLFTESTLKCYHMDGFPALDTADGNEYLRQSSAAGYEVRWHTFACPTVNGMPHLNGRCDSGQS
jgi:hypothetical protein